jgi:hypothetical protein
VKVNGQCYASIDLISGNERSVDWEIFPLRVWGFKIVAWEMIILTEVLHSFPQFFQAKRVIIDLSHYFSQPLIHGPSSFEF